MNVKRLRGPLVAVIGTMLLAGGSVALANDPSPQSAGSTAEEPGSAGPDTDNVEFEDESGADDAAEAGSAEVEGAGADTDNVQDESAADDLAEAEGPGSVGPDTDNVEFEDESGAPD